MFAGAPAIYAFQESRRLRKTDEISSVFSFKCQIYGEYLKAIAKPNERGFPRLAVVVAKKNVPRATARNYIKRVLREIFRLNQARIGGLDIVLLARKGFSRGAYGLVERDFLRLIEELEKRRT
ncbi:MAG: ribonuclease P protein component [Sulfuricella sp.]|nr:ribonuclease P protein component [Sulfuricella sp.]